MMKPISFKNEYVFPSDRSTRKPTNSSTANMALKRMGYANQLVAHGLRSIASTECISKESKTISKLLLKFNGKAYN